jgi:Protein tyrosine and serine/threonine kinase
VTRGIIPWGGFANKEVIAAVVAGERMDRPNLSGPDPELPDEVWELIESCWEHAAADRPSFSEICDRLGLLSSHPSLGGSPPEGGSPGRQSRGDRRSGAASDAAHNPAYTAVPARGTSSAQSAGTTDSADESQFSSIPFKALKVGKEIGRGNFGVVYKAKWRGAVVCVKRLLGDGDDGPMAQEARREFMKEARQMGRLRPHPCVTSFLGAVVDEGSPLCIVTAFVQDGSLYAFLKERTHLHGKFVVSMARDAAAGIAHLHHEGLLHCEYVW